MYKARSYSTFDENYIKPFEIIDNLWFTGTYGASAHLIDTRDGLVLIDTGYGKDLHILVYNICTAGFDPLNIKHIIHTHWHGDHTEATRPLVEMTGAQTYIGEFDKESVLKNNLFLPDRVIKDGDILEFGNISIEFWHTPGHTKGTVSPFFEMGGYKVGMFGGAGANSLVKESRYYYEGCRDDYLASLERLSKREVDVFIGNHVWNNNTEGKGEEKLKTGGNPFINKDEWPKFLKFCKNRLLRIMEAERSKA